MASLFDSFRESVQREGVPQSNATDSNRRINGYTSDQAETMAEMGRSYALTRAFDRSQRGLPNDSTSTSPEIARGMVNGRHAASERVLQYYSAKGVSPDAALMQDLDQLDNIATVSQSIAGMDNGWRSEAISRGMSEFDATTISQTENAILKRVADRTREVMPIDKDLADTLKANIEVDGASAKVIEDRLRAEADLRLKESDLGLKSVDLQIKQYQAQGERLSLLSKAEAAVQEEQMKAARIQLSRYDDNALLEMDRSGKLPDGITRAQLATTLVERAATLEAGVKMKKALAIIRSNGSYFAGFGGGEGKELTVAVVASAVEPKLLGKAIAKSEEEDQAQLAAGNKLTGLPMVTLPGDTEIPRAMAKLAQTKAEADLNAGPYSGAGSASIEERNALAARLNAAIVDAAVLSDLVGLSYAPDSPIGAKMRADIVTANKLIMKGDLVKSRELLDKIDSDREVLKTKQVEAATEQERPFVSSVLHGVTPSGDSAVRYLTSDRVIGFQLDSSVNGEGPYAEVAKAFNLQNLEVEAGIQQEKNAAAANTSIDLSAPRKKQTDVDAEDSAKRQARLTRPSARAALETTFRQATKHQLLISGVKQTLISAMQKNASAGSSGAPTPGMASVNNHALITGSLVSLFGEDWKNANEFRGELNYSRKLDSASGQGQASIEYTSLEGVLAAVKIMDEQFKEAGVTDNLLGNISNSVAAQAPDLIKMLAPRTITQRALLTNIGANAPYEAQREPETLVPYLVRDDARLLAAALKRDIVKPAVEISELLRMQIPSERGELLDALTEKEYVRLNGKDDSLRRTSDLPVPDDPATGYSTRYTNPASEHSIRKRYYMMLQQVDSGDNSLAGQLGVGVMVDLIRKTRDDNNIK